MPPATDAISMADISTDLQNYSLDHQEHLIRSISQIGFGALPGSPIVALDSYVNFLPSSGEVVLTDLLVGDPLQPGGKDSFDPKNNVVKYKTRKASVRPIKVDLKFAHTKILAMYNTYLGRVKTQKIDPETYPYEQYVIEKILESVKKHMRLGMWKAVENANDPSFLGLFNGWIKQITDTIINDPTHINIVDINPITGTNAVGEFDKMIKALPEEIRYSGEGVMIVSTSHMDAYNADYRTKFGALPYNTSFNKTTVDGSNIEIIVEQGVASFNRPIVTTRENLVYLYDDENKQANIDFDYQKRDRSLAYLMDFFSGCGICATEQIWVADAA